MGHPWFGGSAPAVPGTWNDVTTFTATTSSTARLRSDRAKIWAALTDPDLIARITPNVSSIEAEGDRWRWHLTRIPVLGLAFAPVFTEVMVFDEPKRIGFSHDSTRTEETAGVEGSYVLSEVNGGGTDVSIDLTISIDLPLPAAARPVVGRAMRSVVNHMGKRFSRDLLRHLGE